MGWVGSEGSVVNLDSIFSHYRDERREKNTHTGHTSLQRNPAADPGEGPGSPPPSPLIFRPNWSPKARAEKMSLETAPAPPPSFLRVWMTGAPIISRSRYGTDFLHVRGLWFCLFYMSLLAPLCPLCLACIWRLLCVSCMRVSVRNCTWCNRVLASPRVNENFQTKLGIY